MSEGGFPFFGGDPEDLLKGLREFAEQQAESVQEAQREQFATLTLNTAVELTAAALKQLQPSGGVDEQTITALVPTPEILRYAIDLRSLTGGRGRFSVRHDHYDTLPSHLVDRVVKAREEAKEK